MVLAKTRILQIIDECRDVKTFRLEKPDGFDFIAGQYCMVKLGELRPFTFSSSPQENHLDLTVKLMRNVTKKMFALKEGDSLEWEGPHQSLLEYDDSASEIAYIAGGSGITPFMSHIRQIRDSAVQKPVTLIYSNRSQEDIIFADELSKMPSNINVVNTVTEKIPDNWTGETGAVNNLMIYRAVADPKAVLWYVCGPPAMNANMRSILFEMGVVPANLRIESYELPGRS